ncbi:MAG: hypothetical protein J2O44_00240 [Porphyrobacter sp.]|nr:hypothetical protein [Porphyrobacter sp.]
MKLVAPFAAAALAALTISTTASAAMPRLPDMSGDEASALAVYAMPSIIAASRQTCASELSPNGFLAMQGPGLARRYATEQNAAWPLARSALLRVASTKAPDQAKTFASLPDKAVRPLADALIEQEVAAKIHPRSCRNIERMAEAISPLDPMDAGRVLGVMFDIASASDKLVASLESLPARP